VAFQAGALVAFLPTLILSGFIFPIASMPVVLQWVTRVVPARYFLVALRGVVLKGLSLGQIGPSLAALVLYAVAKGHNLLRPMLTGRKPLPANIGAPQSASAIRALLLLLVSAVAAMLLATYL